MGFQRMYHALQKIFPQVDYRILREVAERNSKCADAAVAAVLKKIMTNNTLPQGSPVTPSLCEVESSDDENVGLDKESDRVESWAGGYDSEIVHDVHESDAEELGTSFSNTSNVCVGEPTMEVFDEIIADAGDSKKTLVSGMEYVISLMKEVELKEKAVEQAKVEASTLDANVLSMLEELKQTVQHAKESNAMHAGEVYGEKAILATEFRELQSRALSLSDERDKYLSIIDEMRQTLEARLDAANIEIKIAELEKRGKEKAGMLALAEQESIMEKVVQESKVLKQQDEENAKLQEFLIDRGRVVDMLQGEIASICKDVRLLKKSSDGNVPFSKCLSSSQMISCLDPHEVTWSERDPISCSDEWLSEVEPANRDYRKALVDDGWDLFDDM